MRLPKTFNDITVGQYQECYFALKENTNESWLRVISILSGKPYAEIEAIPIYKIKHYLKLLNFILRPDVLNERVKQYIYAKGIYKAILRADKLNNAQAFDIRSFMKPEKGMDVTDTTVKNAHKLLASIYIPLTWRGFRYTDNHQKEAEKFKSAKMGDVYGTLFFYSILYENLTKHTQDYLEENLAILQEHMTEVKQTLKTDGAGTI